MKWEVQLQMNNGALFYSKYPVYITLLNWKPCGKQGVQWSQCQVQTRSKITSKLEFNYLRHQRFSYIAWHLHCFWQTTWYPALAREYKKNVTHCRLSFCFVKLEPYIITVFQRRFTSKHFTFYANSYITCHFTETVQVNTHVSLTSDLIYTI